MGRIEYREFPNFCHTRGMQKYLKLLFAKLCSREFFFSLFHNYTFILDYVFYRFLPLLSQRVGLKVKCAKSAILVQFKYYITILVLNNFSQFRNFWDFDGIGRSNILLSDRCFCWWLSFLNCLRPNFNFISLSSVAKSNK